MATKIDAGKDKILKELEIMYTLKILKEGIEEINKDKILQPYYNIDYVKKLKKELK